jgi:hypothetical protein
MSRFRTLFAAAAIALVAPATAEAALVTIRDNPNNGSSVFASGLGRSVSITHDGTNRTVGAGVFNLQYNSDGSWNSFMTFCLQLSEWLTLPKEYQSVSGAAYFPNAGDRSSLGVLYGSFLTPAYGLKNSTSAAALQTIVWEIVEDGSENFDLSSGSFRLNSQDVVEQANLFWAMMISGEFQTSKFSVFAAEGTQDLIVSEVPLPGALLLFGTAIAGFGAAKRRRKA